MKHINTTLSELSERYTQARKDQPFTPRAANLIRDCLIYIKQLEEEESDELQSATG